MNTKPSLYLPAWALAWFKEMKPRFDEAEEMLHRHDAFYRLLCADAIDSEMHAMWQQADRNLDNEFDHDEFITTLIYSTDDALPEERVLLYQKPKKAHQQRLRDPAQTLARKLARLLRELFIVTPPRCQAYKAPEKQSIGSMVERLVIAYDFDLALDDLNEIYRRHSIEFTSDSKRGWIQRRRASDAVRTKAIVAARELAKIGWVRDSSYLYALADALERLPDIKTEHASQPELRSHKTGWADWLRVAHHGLQGVGQSDDFLRHRDWAALVLILFDETQSDRRIGQVLSEGK